MIRTSLPLLLVATLITLRYFTFYCLEVWKLKLHIGEKKVNLIVMSDINISVGLVK